MEVKKSPKANLENKKLLFQEIGLIIVLAIVLVAFEWKTKEQSSSVFDQDTSVAIEEETVPITNEQPQLPPEMPKIPILSDAIDIVDDNIQVDNQVFSFEDNDNLGVEIKEYVSEVGDEVIEEEEIPFALVEEKPKFMGGDANTFSKWVNGKLVYPEVAKENGVQGRVILTFIVKSDGTVGNVKVLRGVDSSLDNEAVRIVKSSPKWTPGRQRDRAVNVTYTFPVIFQLR